MKIVQNRPIAEIRSSLKLTQSEFADQLGVGQDAISRWENTAPDELSIPAKMWKKIEAIISSFSKPAALAVTDKWRKAIAMREILYSYLEDKGALLKFDPKAKKDFSSILARSLVKPRIAFMGMSDTGKSTLINCLLGAEKLPAEWTPTTAIVVYIKHRDDRPDFIKDTCWVFKMESEDKPFDLTCLEEESRCSPLCVGKGDADILRDYGVRDGTKNTDEIVAAVLYLDSPILKDVDLVDLPGFGTGDRAADDFAADRIGEYADVLIYLSRSNGFMSGQELTALRMGIQSLRYYESKENDIPPLGNLFVVASQASFIDDVDKLDRILIDGRIRFKNILPSTLRTYP
ncbi:MAG: dynamin family protein [Candidatus Adiutrix sp.]|jgi:DNA-binding XRE family transcriptional regulator|nr:dynamin family protein [Candidatus Adiutrix sp.]